MKKTNWFLKTFTGYTVTHVTVNKSFYVQHRPFRSPRMWSEPYTRTNGRKATHIIFDEAAELTPELSQRLSEAISKSERGKNATRLQELERGE